MVLGLTTTLNYVLLSRPAIRSTDELRDRHAEGPCAIALRESFPKHPPLDSFLSSLARDTIRLDFCFIRIGSGLP